MEALKQGKWWVAVAVAVAAGPSFGVGGTLPQKKQASAVSITAIHRTIVLLNNDFCWRSGKNKKMPCRTIWTANCIWGVEGNWLRFYFFFSSRSQLLLSLAPTILCLTWHPLNLLLPAHVASPTQRLFIFIIINYWSVFNTRKWTIFLFLFANMCILPFSLLFIPSSLSFLCVSISDLLL